MPELGVALSPSVLVWARTTAGVSIEEAARRVGKPPSAVEAWEAGTDEPAIGQLEALADLYERPLAVLLLPDRPDEPPLPTDFRTTHERGGQPLGREARSALRHARDLQETLHEIRSGQEWQPIGATDDGSTEVAAERERERLRLGDDLYLLDASRTFEALRAKVSQLGLLVLQADIPLLDLRAASIGGSPPVIIINEHDLPEAKQFSLFHEYRHLMVGRPGYCAPLAREPLQVDRLVERRCNDFAGAILVPRAPLLAGVRAVRVAGSHLDNDAVLTQLARRFRVSKQVVWYRLLAIGAISAEAFTAKWASWQYFVGPDPRRASGQFRLPARYQLAARRLGSGVVSELLDVLSHGQLELSDVLQLLDVPLEDLPKLESMVGG